MAAIDKTYVSDWDTFNEIRNWANKQQFTLKNGKVVQLSSFLYYPDLTKEEWDEMHNEAINYAKKHYNTPEYAEACKELYGEDWVFDPERYFEIVLWNTPTYVDIWLIRNCPFEYVQDRLKEQYGGGWSKTALTDHNEGDMYQQIKEGRSIYDTFERNGLGKNAKVTFHNISGHECRDKKCFWWIEVNPYWLGNKPSGIVSSPWYDSDADMWYWEEEAMPWDTNSCHKRGPMTKKNIVKLIKKWDLPKGTIVRFSNTYKRYIMHEFYCVVK